MQRSIGRLLVGALLVSTASGNSLRAQQETIFGARKLESSKTPCTTGQKCKDEGYPDEYCDEIAGDLGNGECIELTKGEEANLLGFGVTLCPPGEYASLGDTDYRCVKCGVGTFQPDPGGGQCNCAKAGHIPTALRDNEVPCPRGTFAAGICNTACTTCPDREYQDEVGTSKCKCSQPGEAPSADKRSSSACPRGEFSPGASDYDLPGGIVPGVNCGPPCAQCKQGKFTLEEGETTCDCAVAGSVANAAQTNSEQCNKGTFSRGELDGPCQATCTPCQSGGYAEIKGFAGKLLDDGTYGCSCASAGYTVNAEKTLEVNCGAGAYSPAECSPSCTPCEPGRTSSAFATTECNACQPGSASSVAGSELSACPECVPGRFAEGESNLKCEACPPGQIAGDFGYTSCYCTSRGHYASADRTTEIICAIGTYNNVTCAEKCELCPRGTTSDDPGATQCDFCAKGSAQPEVGASDDNCPLCAIGKYSDEEGLAECESCGIDEYNEEKGRTSCDSCWTVGAGFGFKHSQCTATWLIVGIVAALIVAPYALRFSRAYTAACCKGGRCFREGCLEDCIEKWTICGAAWLFITGDKKKDARTSDDDHATALVSHHSLELSKGRNPESAAHRGGSRGGGGLNLSRCSSLVSQDSSASDSPSAKLKHIRHNSFAVPLDTTGDGIKDSVGLDTNGDGLIDSVVGQKERTVPLDTTGDGIDDSVGLDTTGDGLVDRVVGFKNPVSPRRSSMIKRTYSSSGEAYPLDNSPSRPLPASPPTVPTALPVAVPVDDTPTVARTV